MVFFDKKYSVEVQGKMNSEDHDLLINLYQPLVGADGIGLYQTFIFESKWTQRMKSAVFTIERLCNMSNLSHALVKTLLGNLSRVNLIKIFEEKSTGNIIFAINKPLSAKAFLTHQALNQALAKKLSSENMEAVILFFKDRHQLIENDEYININENFADATDPLLSQLELQTNRVKSTLPLPSIENSFNFDQHDFNAVNIMEDAEWATYYYNCFGEHASEITINSINKLKRDLILRDGVINCLLSYSAKKNQHTFVFKYVAKIAESLCKRKIYTTQEAYNFLVNLPHVPISPVLTSRPEPYRAEVQNVILLDNVDIEW